MKENSFIFENCTLIVSLMKLKFLRLLAFGFIATLSLNSCGNSTDNENDNENKEESLYGGVFSMPIHSYFSSAPINQVQKLETAQVYDQIFEGLVKYNPSTLEVEPSLASAWTVSEDGLEYRFTLKEGVYFHDNECFEGGKGRLLTSEDVIYSFEHVYSNDIENRAYSNFKNTIVGGDAFYNGSAETIEGITAEGNDVIVKLAEPSAVFILKLATIYGSIIPKESMEAEMYVPVGTGPFAYDDKESTSEKVILTRNENYHGVDEQGNKLPFLDKVEFHYFENQEDEMDLFWSEELTYVPDVAISKINEVVEEKIQDFESKPPKYKLISEPQLSTTYLEFNTTNKVLKNKKVRQALNYAINRKKLVEKIMKNQAYEIGKYGITPPLPRTIRDYDFNGIEDVSYQYNPDTAKYLLAQAGYPDGKGFPTLSMQFRLGNQHYRIASEIQSQLRSVLNINIDIEGIEFNELIENQGLGKADIYRSTWFADYPNPETFLLNAYGKIVPDDPNLPSYINSSRYKNAKFDEFFEKGSKAATVEEAYTNYAEAEKILMEDAPFLILWYGEDMMLLQSDVRNFETNGMRYLDLKKVYLKEPTAEEYADKKAENKSAQ